MSNHQWFKTDPGVSVCKRCRGTRTRLASRLKAMVGVSVMYATPDEHGRVVQSSSATSCFMRGGAATTTSMSPKDPRCTGRPVGRPPTVKWATETEY